METSASSEAQTQQAKIDELHRALSEFDPSKLGASWSPQSGGPKLEKLNELADCLEKKTAEIKSYIRTITVEELNELDGFDRCSVAQKTDMDAQRPS